MTNNETNKGISRLNFIKSSGLMMAGLTFLPDFAHSGSKTAMPTSIAMAALADYQLIIPADANAIEHEAAKQLQHYLSGLSGKTVPIVEEGDSPVQKAFYIGRTAFAGKNKVNVKQLEGDAYIYKPAASSLIIAGGSKKGTLYGVYDLLETMGFRKYAPDYHHIPSIKQVTFPQKAIEKVPKITYRTTSYGDINDQAFSDWHKLSSRDSWGMFVHTFDSLVPPSEYGQTHPEYFSMINGSRQPGTQLCLSNEALVDVLVANLKKKIAEKPDAIYWSVSQNDNDQYCRCNNCTALNEKYGGVPSGSILYFVNKVAQAIPDKTISTLAYWYSRKAPKNIKAERNVNIMLCNIESKRQGPVYETDPAFSNDLKDWGKIANDILIWDYNIQFTNLFAPFPNLYTIKPNIKFYTDNHVRALYMQSTREVAAEMAVLRAYLIYKLMWDPDADDKTIINDFVNGYYGAAGPSILTYINTIHESLWKSGMRLDIFGDPVDAKETFLSSEMMVKYKALFDQAEDAVKGDQELLERVQVARLPILFAEIQIGRTEVDSARSLYYHQENGLVNAKPEMKKLVQQFVDGCNKQGVKLVRERSGSPDDFMASYNRIFDKMEEMGKVKSYRKKVIPITAPGKKSKGAEALTDGIFGSYESWRVGDANWVFYKGEHMDFVLDLGEVIAVNAITMDFLNAQAQPEWNLMILPSYVSYALSTDNQSYQEVAKLVNPHNPNPFENPGISKIPIHTFEIDLIGSEARYIKVHAESPLKMPSWHIRTGELAELYSDQIMVK